MLHYNQVRGSRMNRQLPVSVLRRGPIVYYLINFLQHKNYDFHPESIVDDFLNYLINFLQQKNYDFFQESIVNDFLNSVYERFVSGGAEYKIQGYVELINYQQTEIINIENTRVWLMNVYTACHFNS